MIISLANGYEKAVDIVAVILKSRIQAINLVTDAVTYPVMPSTGDAIAITYFPCRGRVYGAGTYSIATLWDIDLTHTDPISAVMR